MLINSVVFIMTVASYADGVADIGRGGRSSGRSSFALDMRVAGVAGTSSWCPEEIFTMLHDRWKKASPRAENPPSALRTRRRAVAPSRHAASAYINENVDDFECAVFGEREEKSTAGSYT